MLQFGMLIRNESLISNKRVVMNTHMLVFNICGSVHHALYW